MAEGAQTGILWKVAAVIFGLAALGAGTLAYVVHDQLSHEVAITKADANQAENEAKDLKAKLDIANQHLEAAGQRIQVDERQISAAQQQVSADRDRLASESRPDLPVRLTFRRALTAQGEVAMMQNLSSRTLELLIDVQSSTGLHFRRPVTINPGQVGQVGPLEGWAFATGQVVTLSNPQFRSLTVTVS